VTPSNSQVSIFDDLCRSSPDEVVPMAEESPFMNKKYRSFAEGMTSEKYFTSSLKQINSSSDFTYNTEPQKNPEWTKILQDESLKLKSHDSSSLQAFSESSVGSGYLPIHDRNSMSDSLKSQPYSPYDSNNFTMASHDIVQSCSRTNYICNPDQEHTASPKLSLGEIFLPISTTTSTLSGETDCTPTLGGTSDVTTDQEPISVVIPEPDHSSSNNRPVLITSDGYVANCKNYEIPNQTYVAESVLTPLELSSSPDLSTEILDTRYETGILSLDKETSSVEVAQDEEIPVMSHHASDNREKSISEDGYVTYGRTYEREFSSTVTLVFSPVLEAEVDIGISPTETSEEVLSSEEFYFSCVSDQLSGSCRRMSDNRSLHPLPERGLKQHSMQYDIGMSGEKYGLSVSGSTKCQLQTSKNLDLRFKNDKNIEMKFFNNGSLYMDCDNESDMANDYQFNFSMENISLAQTASNGGRAGTTNGTEVQFRYPKGYTKVLPTNDTRAMEYQNLEDISDCQFYFNPRSSTHHLGLHEDSGDFGVQDLMEDYKPSDFISLGTSLSMDQDFSLCDWTPQALNNVSTD